MPDTNPRVSLRGLLRRDCIQLHEPSKDKKELIQRMVNRLAEVGVVEDIAAVTNALLERERVMSTGIGGGVAVPHAQSPHVQELAVALSRPLEPIPFESLDERPVGLIFMIVGPEERGGFIRILARISRLLYSGALQARLLAARNSEEVIAAVGEEEERLKGC